MHTGTLVEHQRLVVEAVAGLAAVFYAGLGVRVGSSKMASALARYVVASVSLGAGSLLALGRIPAVVAYGLLCLAITCIPAADLWHEGRGHKRRVASLAPRPMADTVPTVWVVVAAISPLMLTPYVALREQVAAAFMVGVSALVMATIAWRLASSPVQLTGDDDLKLERMRECAWRSKYAGVTAVIAVGSVMVFIGFVNADLPVVTPVQGILSNLSFIVWAGLAAWWAACWIWYGHRLSQSSFSGSS